MPLSPSVCLMQVIGLVHGLNTYGQEHRLGFSPDAGSNTGLHCTDALLAVKGQPGFGREKHLLLMPGNPSQTLRQGPAPVKGECCHALRQLYETLIAFHDTALIIRRYLTPDVGQIAAMVT